MTFRVYAAIIACKLLRAACRILHRGGTALPGRYALKICPDILSILSENTSSIIITGTNGKTTCCRMVEKGLEDSGFSYFANRSGANLISGIATDFIINSSISGKCKKEFAVLETDEAASKEVCRQLQPKIILVTNIFVDQVDRFGSVKNTRDWIAAGIKNAPGAAVCLNADCSVSASLAKDIKNKIYFYGISEKAVQNSVPGGSCDVKSCIECGTEYAYDYITFSHLGGFRCPNCGYSRPDCDFEITGIVKRDSCGTTVSARCLGIEHIIRINLPAMYNVYNAIGSFAALTAAGVSSDTVLNSLSCFKCGFGRMEPLNIGKNGGRMILIKNNAGCDQVLEYLKTVEEDFILAIYLNNNVSDGVDISWLESSEFEALNECRIKSIYVSGMRTDEMYDRLVKAGLEDKLIKEKDCIRLVSELDKSELPVIIMPTYTGMLEMRTEIVRQCGGTDFWEG